MNLKIPIFSLKLNIKINPYKSVDIMKISHYDFSILSNIPLSLFITAACLTVMQKGKDSKG